MNTPAFQILNDSMDELRPWHSRLSVRGELSWFLKIFYLGGWWAGGLLLETPAFQILNDSMDKLRPWYSGLSVRGELSCFLKIFYLGG